MAAEIPDHIDALRRQGGLLAAVPRPEVSGLGDDLGPT
jgi:hypothetical protein